MPSMYDDNFDTVPHPAQQPQMPNQQQPPGPPTQPIAPLPPAYPSPYVPPTPSPRSKRKFRLNRGCTFILVAFLGLLLVGTCTCVAATSIAWITLNTRLSQQLQQAQQQLAQNTFQTAHVYDRDGNPLHELFGEGRRTNVTYDQIPQVMIDATIATEDSTFWSNPGIDVGATLRAGLELVTSPDGANTSGGSTITQQVVRAIAFNYQYAHERSFQRKFEEIMMSLILTQNMSKKQILELYLNQIYYGNLAYGIEAASETYFGIHASQLNLAQATLLAGLPQAPADLDPLSEDPNVQAAVQARHRTVLNLMVEHRDQLQTKLTADQVNATMAQTLQFVDPSVNLKYPHFTLYAEQQLRDLLTGLNLPPSTLFNSGLSVYTTLEPRVQDMTQQIAQQQISTIATQHNAHNAAVVVIAPATGEILAMVGSVDYNDATIQGKINMTTSPRQPGSSIKPLTYSSAFEHGMTAASVLWDVQTRIPIPYQPPYSPTDYDGRYRGPVRVRDALANSLNIPAVETLRVIGVPSLLEIAQRFGVRSLGTDPSQYGLALTLGGGALTPLEEAQAYSVFANGGALVPATAIRCVLNSDGTILYQYENGCPKGKATSNTINASASPRQVLDPRIAFVISDILGDNVARTPEMGANSPLYTPGLASSVKTGTTNDFRDNWTMGYTHNVVVGVWVGNTDDKPMVNTTGLTGAAPIWHNVITGLYADPSLLAYFQHNGALLPDTITPPGGMVRQQVCNLASLKDPAANCAPGRTEWFLNGPPLLMGADGKLAPAPAGAFSPTQPPANGPRPVMVDPDVLQILVQPINQAVAGSMVPPPSNGLPAPPPPIYCEVPNEVKGQVPSAQQQLFIRAPQFPDEAIFAHLYAQAAGIPIEPQLACTPELLSSKPGVNVVARIDSPTPGQTVSGDVPVMGVVTFSPQQAIYYKVEIQGPQFPNWTTVGSTHNQSVSGLLEHFGAQGLQPGQYQLRITVVGLDANDLFSTPGVPITITGQ